MTSKTIIGRKVWFTFRDSTLLGTVRRLDSTYPRTAYSISWSRADNPTAEFSPGVNGRYSVIHASRVLGAA